MRRLMSVVVVLAVALPLCAKEPPDADRDAVIKVLTEQEAAWNRGDLKGFMEGYWNSPEMSFYSGRDKRKGWKETYERFHLRYKAEGKEMGKLTFSELAADRLSETKFLARGRWKVELKAETLDGLFTLILEKKTDGWRIVHDHTSAGETQKKSP